MRGLIPLFNMNLIDKLFRKKEYRGEKVCLVENYRTNEKTAYDGIPTIYYDIYSNDTNEKVGKIELRLSIEGDMYYYGHIGYNISKVHRGNNYAYYACKILFNIAKDEHKLDELIITCSPDNIASYKTLMKLGGELIEQVDVPKGHMLYSFGETKKDVFRFRINI